MPRRRADQPSAHPAVAGLAPADQPAPDRSERVAVGQAAFDRTSFERAAFDRVAFDRAGFDRAPGGVRVGRSGIDRAEPDDRGPDHADDAADVRALIPGPRMPLPSETSGRSPQERAAPSWTGWWAGPDPAGAGTADTDGPAALVPTSTDIARPTSGDASKAGAASAVRPTLRRRVPQAHLAPGLRIVTAAAEPADPAPLPVAAEALSRYQASRAAARSAVDGQVANEVADERSSG
jgi:hypothetical protein